MDALDRHITREFTAQVLDAIRRTAAARGLALKEATFATAAAWEAEALRQSGNPRAAALTRMAVVRVGARHAAGLARQYCRVMPAYTP